MESASTTRPQESDQFLDGWAMGLVRAKVQELIGKQGFLKADHEDLEQELCLEILLRAEKFDPERAKKTAFIRRVVNNKIAAMIRHRKRQKRGDGRRVASLSREVQLGEGVRLELGELLLESSKIAHRFVEHRSDQEQAELVMDVDSVLADMPEDLRAVAERLAECSIAQIRRELGLSKRAVYAAIEEIRRRFVDAGLQDYCPNSGPTRRDLAY